MNRLTNLGSLATISYNVDDDVCEVQYGNGSTTWTYTYNFLNELTEVQTGSTTVAQYGYDGSGDLVQSVESSTQVFAYDGSSRVFAANTGTWSESDYYYADGLLIASVNGTSTLYYHQDALGSVRLVSSSSGSQVYSSNYKG